MIGDLRIGTSAPTMVEVSFWAKGRNNQGKTHKHPHCHEYTGRRWRACAWRWLSTRTGWWDGACGAYERFVGVRSL